jgi:pyruvate kinase
MKTKIIATIGPKSFSYKKIKEMKLQGLDIARINTKWGNKKQ